jgi:hypothetical protein
MCPDVTVHAAVMETCVHGVSTRKVDDLIATLGISESEVSSICAELDTDVAAFSTRDLGERGDNRTSSWTRPTGRPAPAATSTARAPGCGDHGHRRRRPRMK